MHIPKGYSRVGHRSVIVAEFPVKLLPPHIGWTLNHEIQAVPLADLQGKGESVMRGDTPCRIFHRRTYIRSVMINVKRDSIAEAAVYGEVALYFNGGNAVEGNVVFPVRIHKMVACRRKTEYVLSVCVSQSRIQRLFNTVNPKIVERRIPYHLVIKSLFIGFRPEIEPVSFFDVESRVQIPTTGLLKRCCSVRQECL